MFQKSTLKSICYSITFYYNKIHKKNYKGFETGKSIKSIFHILNHEEFKLMINNTRKL